MPSGKLILRDVVKVAGFSLMTVSSALHGKPGVKGPTRAEALAVAEELDYHINLTANMLESSRSNIVHIIVNEFNSPSYSKLTESSIAGVTAHRSMPFMEQTWYSPGTAKHALTNNPFSGQLFDDEIIYASGLNIGVPLSAINHGRPLVLTDTYRGTSAFGTVDLPNEDGTWAVVQYLVGCECHRIAIVGDGYSLRTELTHMGNSSGLYLRGTSDTLFDARLSYGEPTNSTGYGSDSGIETGHAIVKAVLEAHMQSTDDTVESYSPDATQTMGNAPVTGGTFYVNDYAAFGVVRGFVDYGIRVPDDVRVIGFNGATTGSYIAPTLSTVQVNLDQLIQFALDMITHRVEQHGQGDGGFDKSVDMPTTRAATGYTLIPREFIVGSANR